MHDLFIMALCMVPIVVLAGLGVKMCQMWMAQNGEKEPPLGPVWQIAVSCAAIRALAAVVEVYALVRLVLW